MTLFVLALLPVAAVLLVWSFRGRNVVRHAGQVYRRRPDGSFVDSVGTPVVGAALLGALAAAYEMRRRSDPTPFEPGGTSDGSSSDGSGWSWWSDGGSCDSSSSSSSDSGGCDAGGSDGGGGGD